MAIKLIFWLLYSMTQTTLSMEPLPMPCTDFSSLPASTFFGYAAKMPAVLLYARAAKTLLPPAQLENVPKAIVEQGSSRKSCTALQSCHDCWHACMLDQGCIRITVYAEAWSQSTWCSVLSLKSCVTLSGIRMQPGG